MPNLGTLWLLAATLAVPLYFPTRGFARWKRRRRDLGYAIDVLWTPRTESGGGGGGAAPA